MGRCGMVRVVQDPARERVGHVAMCLFDRDNRWDGRGWPDARVHPRVRVNNQHNPGTPRLSFQISRGGAVP